MRKYIGWGMIGLFVGPILIYGFIAAPLHMFTGVAVTTIAFLWVYYATELIEGKTFTEASNDLKRVFRRL